MRKLLFLSILLLIGFIGKTQRVYFIYLESENATPFYVKMGDRIHSSSPAGYLILSNLVDSTYGFSIGLAGKRDVEPRFQVVVAGSDQGFLIKELDQKLHLFNLQSLELIAPLAALETNKDAYTMRSDLFTRTLSLAVNDPSLLMEVVRKEPVGAVAKGKNASKEKESVPTLVASAEPLPVKVTTADTPAVIPADSTALSMQQQTPTPVDSADLLSSTTLDSTITTDTLSITQLAMVADTVAAIDSFAAKDFVAIDTVAKTLDNQAIAQTEGSLSKDTILVTKVDTAVVVTATPTENTLPADPVYKRSTVKRYSESSTTTGFGLTFIDIMEGSTDTIRLIIPNPKPAFKSTDEGSVKTSAPKTIADIEVVAPIDTIIKTDTVAQKEATIPMVKVPSNCTAVATESDFKDLRKEMASLFTDAGMVNIAVEAFAKKCYSTEQVKNLSSLFLSAQWKYLFFEAAQKYITDAENFASLEWEIKDDYYIYKFKALLAK